MTTSKRKRPELLAWIDTETTGLEAGWHEILTLGVKFTDLQAQSIASPVNGVWNLWCQHPERAQPEALAINGLDPQRFTKPDAAVVASKLSVLLYQAPPFIFAGWNVSFDIRFLRATPGFVWPYSADIHTLDVWSLAFSRGWNSLSDACRELGLQRSENHSALEDANLTRKVYANLISPPNR